MRGQIIDDVRTLNIETLSPLPVPISVGLHTAALPSALDVQILTLELKEYWRT